MQLLWMTNLCGVDFVVIGAERYLLALDFYVGSVLPAQQSSLAPPHRERRDRANAQFEREASKQVLKTVGGDSQCALVEADLQADTKIVSRSQANIWAEHRHRSDVMVT